MGESGVGKRRAAIGIGLALTLGGLLAAWFVESRTRAELARRYATLVEGGAASARELELLRSEREELVLAARSAEERAVDLALAAHERYAARLAAAGLAIGALRPGRARELLDETAADLRGFEWAALGLAAELAAPVVWEHPTRISALALSAGGEWLATGDEDGELRLGPARIGATPVVVEVGELVIQALDFDAEGRRLAVGADDGRVRVLGVPAGEELASHEAHEGGIVALAFGAGDLLYTAGDDGLVRAFDLGEQRELFAFEPCAGGIVDLAVNRARGWLCAASDEGEIALSDALDGDLLHEFTDEDERWNALATGAQSESLLAGGTGRVARVLDGVGGASLGALHGAAEQITDLWLADDGAQALVATRAGEIHLFDVRAELELARLEAGMHAVERIAADAAGRRVAFYTANEERVRLWERPALRAHSVIAASDSTATAFAADASAERWFTGRADGSVQVLAPREREPLAARSALATTVRALALSPDGARLAVGGADGALRVLDSGTLAEVLALAGHSQRVVELRFTPDGARLASASADGVFKLWDAHTAELVNEKPGPRQWVLASALSGDGRLGLWVAGGGVVRLWDLESGRRAGGFRDLELGRVTSIALTPDARRLVTATNQHRLRVFDVQTGELLGEAPPRPDLAVVLTTSPDGRRFAAGGADGAVRIFGVDGALELATFPGSDRAVYALAYSPDGRRLGASLAGGGLELWESELDAWLAARVAQSDSR